MLVMLGAGPETRGSIAAVVDAYRMHGLFKRWPIEYVATHGAGLAPQRATLAFKALGRFAALLAEHRRVVLHVHTAPHASFWRDSLYMLVALAARYPVIMQMHGSDFDRFHDACSTPARALIRYFLEQAACVAVPSQRLATWVHSVSPAARTALLPYPVPIPAPRGDSPPNLIVFLGKLEAAKGIFDLLDAVARLRASVPDVRLVCAGEGKRISVALPSYSEGMPVSLLEAMAAGVPVVASPVGGIPEVVADGASGFLCAPGDVQTLHRLLSRLLLDRRLGAQIGAAGRETVRLRFAPERALPRLEQIYADIGLRGLAEGARPVEGDLRKAA
ncbi:MAG: hypothetical protein A3G81_31070 [Betaproteobacteria bacterium RIFCSPLOWO2_12_FULL_65_14]|nr:MAG: hypothetical protein A3G81_31070 [Betaproteobacteria bacterium RIFCSPLOWO2_12_FULL_65_14]